MNTKRHKILLVSAIILAHLLLIYLGGYFLSPEFSLYPYLNSIGLKPYLNIIDQHLPILFFGPMSLPYIFSQNPQPLLSLFLSLLALTDLLFFLNLVKNKVKQPVFWLALFVLTQFVFSGSVLWLETFVTPLILLLFLFKDNHNLADLFSGIIVALIILLRPSLIFAVFLLLAFKKLHFSRSFFAGLLTPFLISLAYLIYQRLIPEFSYLFFSFNRHYYKVLAGKLPKPRQLVFLSILIIPVFGKLLQDKKYLSILLIVFAFLPAWPRFEFEHLLPAIALIIYFVSLINLRKPALTEKIIFMIFLILAAKKISTANYGNFYLTPEVKSVGLFLKNQPEKQIFVLGGSDLIYPLSGKNPAGNYYLPSLPWYYQDQKLVNRQLMALDFNQTALVVVNTASSVDRVPLKNFAQPVYQHILEKYTKIQTIGSFEVYTQNPL